MVRLQNLTMKLMDLLHAAVALIAAKLTIRQELALRRMCRGARDLTAVAVRLARALFGLPQSASSMSGLPISDHAKLVITSGHWRFKATASLAHFTVHAMAIHSFVRS